MRIAMIFLTSTSCLALGVCTGAQAKPVPYLRLAHTAQHPDVAATMAVTAANQAAVQEPRADGFVNANQIYPFMDGAIYRLFAAPEKVSDIALQAGEQLVAISSGDTARWVIGNTYSGAAVTKQVHVLVKPYTAGLKTNLVITTDRRTYHLQLESAPATAMAAISWSYPQDALIALQAAQVKAAAAAPVAVGIAVDDLHFGYAITGDKPAWRPVHVFDDGQKTYIEFPATLAQGEAPPLFVIGEGGQAELLNYRVQHNYYVADRLFGVAELRLGGKHQSVVRITRTDASSNGGGHD
ncbi:P-type conjugative transfer protein TrbG [Asticcacaulis solisilvae]|uniref:P-type conjugative transfer protein TrbG n=1 Tax=Asticcacaulis solisilvae TaxID=1217274 RepID=UPI003FD73FF2